MSTMVGMGAVKKDTKGTEAKLRKENKELKAANKALTEELNSLRCRDAAEASGEEKG